jgi:hypothetical protein
VEGIEGKTVGAVFRGQIDDLHDPPVVRVDHRHLGTASGIRVVIPGAVRGGAPQQAMGRVEAQFVRLGQGLHGAQTPIVGGVEERHGRSALAHHGQLITCHGGSVVALHVCLSIVVHRRFVGKSSFARPSDDSNAKIRHE